MTALENRGNSAAGTAKGPAPGELILIFVVLFLSLPVFVRLRRGDKAGKKRVLYKEKGIAA
jgi:hypothetical protein